jgi:hypothetical protein
LRPVTSHELTINTDCELCEWWALCDRRPVPQQPPALAAIMTDSDDWLDYAMLNDIMFNDDERSPSVDSLFEDAVRLDLENSSPTAEADERAPTPFPGLLAVAECDEDMTNHEPLGRPEDDAPSAPPLDAEMAPLTSDDSDYDDDESDEGESDESLGLAVAESTALSVSHGADLVRLHERLIRPGSDTVRRLEAMFERYPQHYGEIGKSHSAFKAVLRNDVAFRAELEAICDVDDHLRFAVTCSRRNLSARWPMEKGTRERVDKGWLPAGHWHPWMLVHAVEDKRYLMALMPTFNNVADKLAEFVKCTVARRRRCHNKKPRSTRTSAASADACKQR